MERAVFRCARCRVWTGESLQLASASVVCEESELQTIDGVVCVEWEPPRRAIELTKERTRDDGVRWRRSLTIDEDSIRTIDVYCPSPFSMTVIVQVDVSDAEQQCFLLSHVSVTAESDNQNNVPNSQLRLGDRLEMLAFLAALHGHLKHVPLTAEARGLLADNRSARESSTLIGGDKRAMLKRRRVSSPLDFYGRDSRAFAGTPPSRGGSPNDAWVGFYERLQFNVSHSLLCQLEGTAPLSASFPRQQEAFEFADQVVAFREHLAQQRPALGRPTEHDPEEPRVFCFEGANEGKRRFWVTTLSSFWKEYTAIPNGSRHVYEIIREGVPCRLYFDLEFKKKLNPAVDGDALVTRLISLVQLQVYRSYRLLINRDKHVVELDSSTPEKFSRHLTIHFPNGELFANNIHAGAFVRQLINELITTDQETKSPFLVKDNASDVGQHQLFIDVGVYTRNRMFRVLGSSKFRKTAILRPIAIDPEFGDGFAPDHELFLRSIVCPRGARAKRDSKLRLLRCDDAASLKRHASPSSTHRGFASVHMPMRSVESRASIYPALDGFIRSIATTGGAQGEIRAVHLLYADTPLTADDAAASEHMNGSPSKIVYHMMKNRWCENVGRPHKSNNVMFVVDVARREYIQRCHDPHCHAMDYRSPARPLPPGIVLQEIP